MTSLRGWLQTLQRGIGLPDVPEAPDVETLAWADYRGAEKALAQFGLAADPAVGRVLDVGCGLGGKTLYYAEHGARLVVGLEISAERARVARAFAAGRHATRIQIVVGDALHLPFRADAFDRIVSTDTWEHLPAPAAAASECARVAAPGGTVAVSALPYGSPWGGHTSSWVKVPWLHVILPRGTLFRLVAHVEGRRRVYARVPKEVQVDWRRPEDPGHARRLTLTAFERSWAGSGLVWLRFAVIPVGSRSPRPLAGSARWLARLPLFRELLSGLALAVLRKPPAVRGVGAKAMNLGLRCFDPVRVGPPREAREIYDALYARDWMPPRTSMLAWLLRLLEPQAGRALLDVACGDGQLGPRAEQAGLRYYGVDISGAAVRTARRAGVFVSDGEALPFADDRFDYVMSIGSLEHYVDPALGARELARVLKPDGRACVLLPNAFGLTWNVLAAWRTGDVADDDGQPIQRFATRRAWEQLLIENGLRVRRTVGYERSFPRTAGEWRVYARQPKEVLLALLSPFLSANMMRYLVFVCEKAAADSGSPSDRDRGTSRADRPQGSIEIAGSGNCSVF